MIDSTVGWSQFSTAWCVLYGHLKVRGSRQRNHTARGMYAYCQLMLHASVVIQIMQLKKKKTGAEAVAQ